MCTTTFHAVTAFCQLPNKRICYVSVNKLPESETAGIRTCHLIARVLTPSITIMDRSHIRCALLRCASKNTSVLLAQRSSAQRMCEQPITLPGLNEAWCNVMQMQPKKLSRQNSLSPQNLNSRMVCQYTQLYLSHTHTRLTALFPGLPR